MDIVVGQVRPVWLIFDVRPTVVDKRVKFEIGRRQFDIPTDNYYVTTPQVGVAVGTPLIRNRIANTVSSKLVQGAYERKTEIEQKVVDAVPGLVQRLEQELDKSLTSTREIGGWPMPAPAAALPPVGRFPERQPGRRRHDFGGRIRDSPALIRRRVRFAASSPGRETRKFERRPRFHAGFLRGLLKG